MNGPFTRAGQRTVQRWARHAAASTGQEVRVDGAAQAYVDLSRRVEWPWHPVLRWHLAAYLLPGVAVYRTLLAAQVPQPEARQAVARALVADNEPRRLRLRRLGQHRWFYGVFAVAVRALSSLLYPRPGWRIRWGEVSRARIAFDIDRCYYLDVLTRLGMPELTPAYCHLDDVLYTDISPQVAWQRDHTLAAGCDRCTFRYHRRPPGSAVELGARRDHPPRTTAHPAHPHDDWS